MTYFLYKEAILLGPIFLLCTLALGFSALDLLTFAIGGFALSALWQLRGACYAIGFLALYAACKHAFFISDHLWNLGLEGSLACAFFITALAFEQKVFSQQMLDAQVATKQQSIENLEEELASLKQTVQEQQIVFQDKAARAQQALEELQSEHASIVILNEVLRKTTARHISMHDAAKEQGLDLTRQIEILRTEYAECRAELNRLASSDALAMQNEQLMQELNDVRCSHAQLELIHETLNRLYASEKWKSKEAEQEADALAEQLAAARRQVVHVERIDPQVSEDLAFANEKLKKLTDLEPLFKQLKKQFEEKNHVLHQTRSQLFLADTELQKMKMEKVAAELHPIPQEVEEELQGLGSQLTCLEEENHHLQELVTHLMDTHLEAAKRKKKVKTQSSPDQALLF